MIIKNKKRKESFGACTGEEGRSCVFPVQRDRNPCRSDNSALFLFSIQLFIDELGKIELKVKEETMVDRSKSSRGAIFEMLPAESKREKDMPKL